MLLDRKGRRYLVHLRQGAEFQFHRGTVPHDDIIGKPDGTVVNSSHAAKLVALRPRLADYVLAMRRGAQVIYPKDLGPILIWGDIAPGQRVLEAGTGSGALTMVLLRAVGATGTVVSVEERADHLSHAEAAIVELHGKLPPQLELRLGRVENHIADVAPDRLILDIPEPWHLVPPAAAHLASGGVFVTYLPTIPQVQQVRTALKDSRCFTMVDTFEVLHRTWSVEGRSVRPDHQMVGHTGFITVARRVQSLRD